MGDFWKPTADMFTSLFEKPKMAEKLLIKPPFKYIYDIFAETTKSTNFAKGSLQPTQVSTAVMSSPKSTTRPRTERWKKKKK